MIMNERSESEPRFFTGRISGWVRRHRRVVLVAWLIFAVVTIGTCTSVGPNEDLGEVGKGESAEASRLFQDRFEVEEAALSETIVFSHPTLTVDDAEYREKVEGLLGDLKSLRHIETETIGDTEIISSFRIFTLTFSHYDIGLPREDSPLVAHNETGGDVTFVTVEYAGEYSDVEGEIDRITEIVAQAAEGTDFVIDIGGDATINKQLGVIIEEDFAGASSVNIALTLIILLVALGAVIAAGVPIILAYLGVFMAAGIVVMVSYAVPMFQGWIQIVLLMGLAASIDYTLFLFTRFRTERERGKEPVDAVTTASHTAGKGVFIAAITTMIALTGMFLSGNVIFNSIGLAAVISIMVALLAALTLTPALLGDGLGRLNIPKIGRRYNVAQAGLLNPLAGRLVRLSVRRPWIVAPLVLIIMLALTYPMLDLNLGFNGAGSFHDDLEAKAAIEKLEDNFTIGLLSPAVVVVDPGEGNNIFAADVQQKVDRLIELIREENLRAEAAGEHVPFEEPIQTDINRAGDTELVKIPVNADTGDKEALDAVSLLREEIISDAFPDDSVRALVTGATAGNADFQNDMNSKTWLIVAFVVVTAFLLLVFLYRSLLIPLIAVFLNLLAVGAGYGLLKLVFQDGRGLESLLGFEATGIIEFWLPMFVFTVMFGISMDYLSFAITRVQELYNRGWSTRDAIVEGVRGSFGVVFSAAAIMIAVAAVFAVLMRFFAMQQMGFALAIAVIFDTTVILLLMLPAFLGLAGDRLWYLPSWLQWIPGRSPRTPAMETLPSPALEPEPAPFITPTPEPEPPPTTTTEPLSAAPPDSAPTEDDV
jgi:RND superfamily putative drug exporter